MTPAPGQYRGNATEQAVERLLRALGYLTASRRHFGGAGDILALPPSALMTPDIGTRALRDVFGVPLLVEVKGTRDYPWASTWGPAARAAMIAAGELYGLEPLLAWWPPGITPASRGGQPMWIPAEDWPAVPALELEAARAELKVAA